MTEMILNLHSYGCATDEAIERFMGDEELYCQLLHSVLDDPAYQRLSIALKENNIKTAFEAAHSLKGIFGNMGLTPLYSVINDIVGTLRAGNSEGVDEKFMELLTINEEIKAIVNKGEK